MESTSSSRTAKAMSTTSSSLSPNPYDPPAAGHQTGASHVAHCLDAIIVGMGAADGRVEPAAGIQIVIHPAHTGRFERPCLVFARETQRKAELEIGELTLDSPRGLGKVLNVRLRRSPAARDHAVASGSRRHGSPGAFQELVLREQAILRNPGSGDRGL